MLTTDVAESAKIIWAYHRLNQPLKRADILLVLGGHDLRVPAHAAKLYLQGLAPLVVVSGGVAHQDDLLKTAWPGTEADKFAEVLKAGGVPDTALLLEREAKNTGENFVLARRLLEARAIRFDAVIAVTKPYMERRAYATGAKRWSDTGIIVTSPQLSFEDYMDGCAEQGTDQEDVVNIMMGDLQRIDVYGRNGFQIPQEIPAKVWEAFERLVRLGYTRHLLQERS